VKRISSLPSHYFSTNIKNEMSTNPPTHDASFYGTREGFISVYEEISKFITEEVVPAYPTLPIAEVSKHMKDMMDYNVPGGKLNRGLTVVHALESIVKERTGSPPSAVEAKRAAVLGWCIEWLQAFFLVADDIMDASPTRRGQPCWYKLPHINLVAINDGFLLQAHLYRVLKEHFSHDPSMYISLFELFNETTFQTELGQLLDLTSQPQPTSGEPIDLDRFTIQRYKAIVEYKTAYYSFYLPVACALVIAGVATPDALKASKEILVVMGEYFQVQDDYLDCYADAETLGKIGTDIQDNKCGWLVVNALANANAEQVAILKAHYGKHNDESVAIIKQLYRDMNIEKLFFDYEAASYATLQSMIAEKTAATGLPAGVFLSLLSKIYKRQK
jgi:farnesyl diphosphate synthase